MHHPDYLFRLIRSLAIAEKRYFKIYARKYAVGNKNNYEKLFDAFDNLPRGEAYNENAFKKMLRGKAYGKNLAADKNYLANLILDAMTAFHAEHTPEARLNALIAQIRFLHDKGLHEAANKKLNTAFELCALTESLPAFLILYQYKNRLTRENTPEFIQQDIDKEQRILRQLLVQQSLVHLRIQIAALRENNELKPRAAEFAAQLGELTKDTSVPLTNLAAVNLCFSRAYIANAQGDHAQAMKHYEAALPLWRTNPFYYHEQISNVAATLHNYLVNAFRCERFEVFPPIIAEIEALPVKSFPEEVDVFRAAKQNSLLYLLNAPSAKLDGKLIAEIENGLQKYNALLSPATVVRIRTNICLAYLFYRKYEKLLAALAPALELIGRDKRFFAMQRELRFAELMAHCSLRNTDLMLNRTATLEKWLKRNSLANAYTDALLEYFRARAENKNGQPPKADCPPETVMTKEIFERWIKNR